MLPLASKLARSSIRKKELFCTFFVTRSVLKNAAEFVRQQFGPPDTLTAQTDLKSDADVRHQTDITSHRPMSRQRRQTISKKQKPSQIKLVFLYLDVDDNV